MKAVFGDDSYVQFLISGGEVTIQFCAKNGTVEYVRRYTAGAARNIRDMMTRAIVLAEVAAMTGEELDAAISARKKEKLSVVLPFARPPVGRDDDS